MKTSDCTQCNRGVMHSNVPLFYRVTVEVMGIDLQAVQAKHGEELMMGPLSNILGTDPDIAKPIDTHSHIICLECMTKNLAQLI